MGRTNTGSILRLQDMPPYDDQMIPGLLTCVHMTMGKYHRSEGIDPIGHKTRQQNLGETSRDVTVTPIQTHRLPQGRVWKISIEREYLYRQRPLEGKPTLILVQTVAIPYTI